MTHGGEEEAEEENCENKNGKHVTVL